MKFISNILMLAVLVFNNLSVLPLAFPARQSTLALSSTPTETPTPTETALPPIETPAPIEPATTPVFGGTPSASPTNTTTLTSKPNEKWVGDITYIDTAEGWLYLASIMDLYSRRIIGWSMADCMDVRLAENAWGSATMITDKLYDLLKQIGSARDDWAGHL